MHHCCSLSYGAVCIGFHPVSVGVLPLSLLRSKYHQSLHCSLEYCRGRGYSFLCPCNIVANLFALLSRGKIFSKLEQVGLHTNQLLSKESEQSLSHTRGSTSTRDCHSCLKATVKLLQLKAKVKPMFWEADISFLSQMQIHPCTSV